MAKRKTSVEKAREEADLEAVGDLFGSAFSGSEKPNDFGDNHPLDVETEAEEDDNEDKSEYALVTEELATSPSGPPGGPPSPANEENFSEYEDSEMGEEEIIVEENTFDETLLVEEENSQEEEPQPEPVEEPVEEPDEEPAEETITPKEIIPSADRTHASDEEMARLSSEVTSLRQGLAGAVDIIEEMETPPMPPVVYQDIIVPDHIVTSIARLSRQLNRDGLVRASMGTISMLHPEMPGAMISTKEGALLARLDERDIAVGRLGEQSPHAAPEDWRLLEVLLASKSLETNGPATCLHVHGPYTTAVSCEKDLILCSPIDHAGKKHIGKIIIVDPDEDNPEDFLRQTAEALKQGGMKCVVVRGHGAFVVGATLEESWANAAMLEHSMKIVLLARQANIKV